MIEAIRVRNWQSLTHLDLQLGRYTVIVGASSSGKTALMRAFKALASNVRGSSQLTRGTSTAAVTAILDDGEVTLEHKGGSWTYRSVVLGHEETYTKLDGRVPAQITNVLGIAPVPTSGTSINFAGQFDRPYLLSTDDSGAKVARVLGELTNVHLILAVVREANRRRSGMAATLKVREADLAATAAKVGLYADLPARLAAFSAAETIYERVQQLQVTVQRLRAAVEALEAAQRVLDHTVLPVVPDISGLEAVWERVQAFRALMDGYLAAKGALDWAYVESKRLNGEETDAWERLQLALKSAGECPTCGRTTTDRIQTATSAL